MVKQKTEFLDLAEQRRSNEFFFSRKGILPILQIGKVSYLILRIDSDDKNQPFPFCGSN